MRPKNLKYSRVIYLILFVMACIGTARFCHHQTKGFALSKITGNFPLETEKFPLCEIPPDFLRQLCCQPFHFLGRGFQSFVFVSADDRYVLKLFSNRYQKKITLFSLLSYFPFGHNWAIDRKTFFQNKLDNSFTSYQLALTEMADQTALVYLHLTPTTDLPQTVTLIDPLHISHQIDLNQFGFLLQKKVSLVYPTLQEWIQLGREDLAKQAISSLIQLFIWKWQHTIADNDPLIRTNYGFIDTKAIQIDVGPLSKREEREDSQLFAQEMRRITTSLKNWLSQNAPQLVSYLDQELADQLSSAE